MKTIGVFVGAFGYFALCFVLLMLIGLVYVLPIMLYVWMCSRLTYTDNETCSLDGGKSGADDCPTCRTRLRPWVAILLPALLGVALALICLCMINLVACGRAFAGVDACVLNHIPG